MKVNILNMAFDNYTKAEFIEKFENRIHQQEKTLVVTANPEIVMYAKDNQNTNITVKNEADYS